MFVDRKNELDTLNFEYNRKESSFVVIYGRRRVGKTTLINHFCKDKRSIYYLATEENETENLNSFKDAVASAMNNTLLSNAGITSWEPVFELIANESRNSRIILVIDEFQYLGKANAAFPSVMMKIWDNILSKANVMLIICGSLINMMTSQVLSYGSPLYGRRTAQIKMKQIPFSCYHEFNDSLTYDEQIQYYAVTGGIPKYIELFTACKDISTAIRNNILSPSSFLYAEPEFLLQKEVTGIGSYFSILKTIAAGNHKLGKIAAALGINQSGLTSYLKTLTDLDLIERQVPVTEENPEKSKMGLYFIKDNFVAFWFKFIFPNRGMIESGHTDYVEDKIKKNLIDNHVSYVYEDICREKLWDMMPEIFPFNRVGRWWGSGDIEIDIIAYDPFGSDMLFGECKYSAKPKGMDILLDLKKKAGNVKWKTGLRKEHFIIFSRSGFDDSLKQYADSHPEEVKLV